MRRSEQGDSDIRVDHWVPTADEDQAAPAVEPELVPIDSRPDSAPGIPPDRA